MRTHTLAQRNAIKARAYAHDIRVKIESPDGVLVDVAGGPASLFAKDWLVSARVAGDQDRGMLEGDVVLWRYDAPDDLSLSPEVGASPINRDNAAAYARFLDLGRAVKITTWVGAQGVVPNEADFVEIFDGYIAAISGEGTDFITLRLHGRGAEMAAAKFEAGKIYGSPEGTLAETVYQEMLDDVLGVGAPALYTPVSPGVVLREFEVKEADSLFEKLRAVALSTGQDIRWKYDAAGLLRLTYYTPARGVGAALDTLGPDEYKNADPINKVIDDVVNAVTVKFTNEATGDADSVTSEDAASIAQYGRRWALVEREAADLINTPAEATDLADIIVNDLSEPWADHAIELPLYWIAEVGDSLDLLENARDYDTTQTFAVAAYEHRFENGEGTTRLTMRGHAAGAFREWAGKLGRGPGGKKTTDPASEFAFKNFRQKRQTPTQVTFGWDPDSRFAVIWYWEKLVTPEDLLDTPGLDHFWNPDVALDALPAPTKQFSGDTTELVVAVPEHGKIRVGELVGFDKNGGPTARSQRVKVLPSDAIPTIFGVRYVPGATNLFGDVTVEFNDSQALGGTLYAWVNHDSPDSVDVSGPYDGSITFLTTPNMATPLTEFDLFGGGFGFLLDNISVHGGRGKIIAFEFVNSQGVSSGVQTFYLSAQGSVIGPDGELLDGSVKTGSQFAAGLGPVYAFNLVSELPAGAPDNSIASVAGVLYKKKPGVGWTLAVDAVELTGELQTVQIALGAITNALLAAGAVTTTKILDGSISTPKLIAGAVDTTALAAGAVTAVKILAGSITGDRIATRTLAADRIQTNAITASEMSANSIAAASIQAGAISTVALQAGAVTSTKMTIEVLSDVKRSDGTTTVGLGIIVSGKLQSLDGLRYLDLNASGSGSFLHTPSLDLFADGSATFTGTVASTLFTGSGAFFTNGVGLNGTLGFVGVSGNLLNAVVFAVPPDPSIYNHRLTVSSLRDLILEADRSLYLLVQGGGNLYKQTPGDGYLPIAAIKKDGGAPANPANYHENDLWIRVGQGANNSIHVLHAGAWEKVAHAS